MAMAFPPCISSVDISSRIMRAFWTMFLVTALNLRSSLTQENLSSTWYTRDAWILHCLLESIPLISLVSASSILLSSLGAHPGFSHQGGEKGSVCRLALDGHTDLVVEHHLIQFDLSIFGNGVISHYRASMQN